MMGYYIGMKNNVAVIEIAPDIDEAFRVCGKALGIDVDKIADTGNIDLDLCKPIKIGTPFNLDEQ